MGLGEGSKEMKKVYLIRLLKGDKVIAMRRVIAYDIATVKGVLSNIWPMCCKVGIIADGYNIERIAKSVYSEHGFFDIEEIVCSYDYKGFLKQLIKYIILG